MRKFLNDIMDCCRPCCSEYFLFADFHGESIHTNRLPQKDGEMQGKDWEVLSKKYPHPKWRMEQMK